MTAAWLIVFAAWPALIVALCWWLKRKAWK